MSYRGWMLGLCGAACVVAGSVGARAGGTPTDVLHYWVSGGESAAIRVLADAYGKQGGKWVDDAVAGGDAEKQTGLSRIQGGNPPTAMMWNVGVDVTELAKQGLLDNVDAVAERGNWARILPPAVLDRITYQGHTIAVPLNIHGENWLFANNAILRAVGAQMPKSWDEFFATADKVKQGGYIPVAMGGQPWQEVMALRAIVASQGSDFYRKVFVERDPSAAASPGMRKAFETLARLKTYTDPASTGRKWNDTTNLVITGKAAFQFMGDWAKGEFRAAGQVAGKEYSCALPPGGGTGYIIAVDVFVFPKTADPASAAAQAALAGVMMDKDVQVAFNQAKGSVPIRLDVSGDNFDECGKLAIATLANASNQLPNAALAVTDDMEGGIEDLVTAFWTNPAPDLDATLQRFATLIKGNG